MAFVCRERVIKISSGRELGLLNCQYSNIMMTKSLHEASCYYRKVIKVIVLNENYFDKGICVGPFMTYANPDSAGCTLTLYYKEHSFRSCCVKLIRCQTDHFASSFIPQAFELWNLLLDKVSLITEVFSCSRIKYLSVTMRLLCIKYHKHLISVDLLFIAKFHKRNLKGIGFSYRQSQA